MVVVVSADALQVSRLMLDTPAHEGDERAEQRYKAVMAVISEGRTITQVARDWGVSRQTVHAWLARYEADGLEGLANLSHRPAHNVPKHIQLLSSARNKASSSGTPGSKRNVTYFSQVSVSLRYAR